MDNKGSVLQSQSGVSKFGGFYHLRRITEENTSPEQLRAMWEKLLLCEYAFDDFTRGKIDFFLELFTSDTVEFYDVDDCGLAILRNVVPSGGAELHYVIWDPNKYTTERQRISAKELLDYLFYDRRVHHVYGIIPSFNQRAVRTATTVGMKYEGEIRDNFLYHGKYYNHLIYGLLESEWTVRRNRL